MIEEFQTTNNEKDKLYLELEDGDYMQEKAPVEFFKKYYPEGHIENIKGKSIFVIPVEGNKFIKICFGKQKIIHKFYGTEYIYGYITQEKFNEILEKLKSETR